VTRALQRCSTQQTPLTLPRPLVSVSQFMHPLPIDIATTAICIICYYYDPIPVIKSRKSHKHG
jgi:hypothetical protein